MRILLLEDDRSLANLMRGELERRGHAVLWFQNVRDARATLPPVGFQAVVCDYELPDGLGTDFLRDLYASAPPHPRVLLWSGLDRTREADAAGIKPDAILTKSATIEALDLLASWDEPKPW